MKTLGQFISEKITPTSRAYLYHYTNSTWLGNILKLNAIGQQGDYDPTGPGVTSLKGGLVSFTRDKRYRVKGNESDVRFVFDQDILRHYYRIVPRVATDIDLNHHISRKRKEA